MNALAHRSYRDAGGSIGIAIYDTGLLESIYPEQPSHPKQKYRLTDKGKDLLKRQ